MAYPPAPTELVAAGAADAANTDLDVRGYVPQESGPLYVCVAGDGGVAASR